MAKANFPRFNRDHQERYKVKQRNTFPPRNFRSGTRNGRSYAATLKECGSKVKAGGSKDKDGGPDGEVKKGPQRLKTSYDNEWKGISFIVDKKSIGWLERSYVGLTHSVGDVLDVQ